MKLCLYRFLSERTIDLPGCVNFHLLYTFIWFDFKIFFLSNKVQELQPVKFLFFF